MSVHTCMCHCSVWQPEENLEKLALSFYHVPHPNVSSLEPPGFELGPPTEARACHFGWCLHTHSLGFPVSVLWHLVT